MEEINEIKQDNISVEDLTFPSHFTDDDVRLEIETWKADNNERIICSHSAVIKTGKETFQIATCLEIVNEHTGELHHYAIEIHNVRRYKKKGLVYQEKYRITDLGAFNSLYTFFSLVKGGQLGTSKDKKVIISDEEYQKLNRLSTADPNLVEDILKNEYTYKQLWESGGTPLLKDILQIALKEASTVDLIQRLKELDIEELKELNSLAGISQLKTILDIWNNNQTNDDEEFWQKVLNDNSWIISQLFSFPLVLFAGKAYVGGKWIDNKGGNVADFIYQNNLTANVVLVEIKTPETKLIGGAYRHTYSVSPDLSGSANQVLNYKQKLSREYGNIIANNPDKPRFDAFNPKCILIIGNFDKEIKNDYRKKEAFELYRSNSSGADIITFDELFKKVEMLINLLEGN